jgi:nucleoid-associated protein EbfC
MNIQNMMKQAQKLQQDMMKTKNEIDNKIFPGKYSFVEIEANGKKEILKIKIDKSIDLSGEDVEMLEDVLLVVINNTFKEIDKETEEKMGKFSNGLPGLF